MLFEGCRAARDKDQEGAEEGRQEGAGRGDQGARRQVKQHIFKRLNRYLITCTGFIKSSSLLTGQR